MKNIYNNFFHFKEIEKKLKNVNLGERIYKKYSIVPLGFATKSLVNLNNPNAVKFLRHRLSIYKTPKKIILLLLLKLKLFKVIQTRSFKNIDLILLSRRLKLMDFENKKVYTFGDKKENEKIKKNYLDIKNNMNYNIQLKIEKDLIEEKLLFPEQKIKNNDIKKIFCSLCEMYNKTKKKVEHKIYFDAMKELYITRKKVYPIPNIKIPEIEYYNVTCHGDFCKLNLIKHDGEIFLIDLESVEDGDILRDFTRFFLAEYLLSGNLDLSLFISLKNIIMEKCKIKEKYFYIILKNHVLFLESSVPKLKKYAKKLKETILYLEKNEK